MAHEHWSGVSIRICVNTAFVLTACLTIALRVIVLNTSVSVRHIRLVVGRVISLAFTFILLGFVDLVSFCTCFRSRFCTAYLRRLSLASHLCNLNMLASPSALVCHFHQPHIVLALRQSWIHFLNSSPHCSSCTPTPLMIHLSRLHLRMSKKVTNFQHHFINSFFAFLFPICASSIRHHLFPTLKWLQVVFLYHEASVWALWRREGREEDKLQVFRSRNKVEKRRRW